MFSIHSGVARRTRRSRRPWRSRGSWGSHNRWWRRSWRGGGSGVCRRLRRHLPSIGTRCAHRCCSYLTFFTSATRTALAGFGGLSALGATVKSGASLALTDHLASVAVAGADCARARLVHHFPWLQHSPVLQCTCPTLLLSSNEKGGLKAGEDD